MNRSENFIEVFKAIEKARPLFKSLKKECTNSHFKSGYADIDTVLHSLKDGLKEANLSVMQFPNNKDGIFVLTTIVSHTESGAYIENDYPLLVDKNTSQGQGSAITYARRYSLTAIFGLHEFDDDGNASSEEPEGKKPPEEKKVVDLKELITKVMDKELVNYVEDREALRNIFITLRDANVNPASLQALVKMHFEKKLKKKGTL